MEAGLWGRSVFTGTTKQWEACKENENEWAERETRVQLRYRGEVGESSRKKGVDNSINNIDLFFEKFVGWSVRIENWVGKSRAIDDLIIGLSVDWGAERTAWGKAWVLSEEAGMQDEWVCKYGY